MSADLRNPGPGADLRNAAARELENERAAVIIAWMWDILALPSVVAVVPESAKSAWAEMLDKRTYASANAASASYANAAAAAASAANANAAAYAAAGANGGVGGVGGVGPGLWPDADPVGLLERLITVWSDES